MTVNVIVQARMNSTRLPGKVMREIDGKPLIGYLLDRLYVTTQPDKIVIAIPKDDKRSPLGKYLRKVGADIAYGPEQDVAARFAAAIEKYPCDAFVRICSDSPLIDPQLVNMAAKALKISHQLVFVTHGLGGTLVEGAQSDLFLRALPRMDQEEREHVTLFFKRRLSLAVDTEEDFTRVASVITAMDGNHLAYGHNECVEILEQSLSGLGMLGGSM